MATNRTELIAAVVVSAITVACAGDRADRSYRVVDSAGIRLVSNGDRGAWIEGSIWQLREELRIAPSADDPDGQLGRFGGLAVNSRGDILVLDALNQRVLQHDSTGRYLRSLGRPGSGPGELGPGGSTGSSVLVGAADSIVIPDMGNLRVSVFSPEGSFVRAFSISLDGGPPMRWAVLPGGRLVEQVQTVLVKGQTATPPINALLAVAADGAHRDTLLRLPLGPVLDVRGGVGTVKTRLLTPEVVWDAADDGRILVAESSAYRIFVYDANGVLRMVVSKPAAPRPVSSEDRRDVLDAFTLAVMGQRPQMADSQLPATVRKMLDNVEIAATYPAFAAVRAGPDGTVMVRHAATIRELKGNDTVLTVANMREGSRDWDVFDRDGRYLGVVRFPPRFHLASTVRNAFYGVLRDSLDAPSIVKLVRHGHR